MHISRFLPGCRSARIPGLLAALVLTLGLSACGITDEAGTRYRIALVSATDEDSLAPIGALQVGEVARVTFEVTPAGAAPVDRTPAATFRLVDERAGDDASAFEFTLSDDLDVRPYHTLTGDVPGAEALLCAAYAGPEVLTGAVEDCLRVLVLEPDEA